MDYTNILLLLNIINLRIQAITPNTRKSVPAYVKHLKIMLISMYNSEMVVSY